MVASVREVIILILVIAPCHAVSGEVSRIVKLCIGIVERTVIIMFILSLFSLTEKTERTAELVHDILNIDVAQGRIRKEVSEG